MNDAELLAKAIKFQFGEDLYVESRGITGWVVSDGSAVRNTLGEWEYEPRPSSRTEDFILRTRRPLEEAVRMATELAGMTRMERYK